MLHEKIQKLLAGQGDNYIFPFFWQHGESETVLRKYMQIIHQSSIGAVCIESRPHPDFCGDGWWHDMDIILDEARKRGMKVWILDDSHFPTGFANGAMAAQPDGLCRQSLCCRCYALENGEALHLEPSDVLHPAPFEKNMAEQFGMNDPQREFHDDCLLSACAWDPASNKVLDLRPYVSEGRLDWTAPAGAWNVYLLHLSRNYGYHRSYINMMDKRSCKVLLDAVYEPHYEHYKEDFGKTIAGFFSDEPELGNGHMYETNDPYGSPNDYPWSSELELLLRSRLGDELELLLPLMWENDADPKATARLRHTYMDAVTRLVQEDFSEQIGGWCRSHGVAYIGHLIEDDNHHTRTGSSLGHYFRGLAGQDMAGIDDIGGQVFPQGEDISYYHMVFSHRNGEFYHYMLGKLADSAAAIEPRKQGRAMCEIFGNYGWAEGVRLEKYLVDHFLVRGINHFVPHAFSAKAYPDPDCPPHFYAQGHNPQYRHFGCLMAYTNRVCELLNGGYHAAPVAVLYHAEADWTGRHMTSDQVGHRLADTQIEYDYLPQDVFSHREAYCTRIVKQRLCVNTQSYQALVIPYCQFITAPLAEAIAELTDAGIPVLYINASPDGLCTGNGTPPAAECVPLESLADILIQRGLPELSLSPAGHRIRYRHYLHGDGCEIYLFVNEGTEPYNGYVTLPDVPAKAAYIYNAWNNCLEPLQIEGRRFRLDIVPLHSRIVIFDKTAAADDVRALVQAPIHVSAEKQAVPVSGPWRRDICRSIDYPAFTQEKEVQLPDTLAAEEPEFSGFVRYRNSFSAGRDDKIYLEITDAHEGVEVFLNGKSLGIQIVPPYCFDLTAALSDGKNELFIEVATTLERENSNIPDVMGQIKEPTALSGITGMACLWLVKK